jgi:hypothetical protein
MNQTKKILPALLTLLLLVTLANLMVLSASAADPPAPTVKPNIPTPSVPQFTLTYADHSYNVPAKTTSSTDPYTGKVTTNTIPGYHVKNFTIDVSIKNQPYPSTINHGNASTLKYFIQAKGHFESEDHFLISGDGTTGASVIASDSGYTVVSIPIEIYEGAVDFRVQASLGYDYMYSVGLVPMVGWASAESDWSSTQTISLNDGSTSTSSAPEPTLPPTPPPTMSDPSIGDMGTAPQTSQNPTSTPVQPISGNPAFFVLDFGEIVIIALLGVVAVLLGLAVVYLRRRSSK